MNIPLKKKNKSVFERKLDMIKKKLFLLRAGLFLAVVFPVSIITLGKAVISEYIKIKTGKQ